MANNASVGLRVFLQDDATSGLAKFATGLIDTRAVMTNLVSASMDFSEALLELGSVVIGTNDILSKFRTTVAGIRTNMNNTGQSFQDFGEIAIGTGDIMTDMGKKALTAMDDMKELDASMLATVAVAKDLTTAETATGDATEGAGNKTKSTGASLFMLAMAFQQTSQTLMQLNTTLDNAVISSGNLEDAFIRAQIATKATGTDVQTLNDAIVRLSDQGMFSTQQVSDGFQQLGERGYNTAQIVNDNLGVAIMNLAEITKTDMVTSADLMTTALHDFGATAQDSTRYASALSYAFFNGIPDVNGLMSALQRLGPSASSLHIPFEDVMSSLIYLSQHGMPDVSQAGTALNYMMAALSAPSSTAASTLKALGVSMYDMKGHLKDLPTMVSDLFAALAKQPDSQAAVDLRSILNIRSGQAGKVMGANPNIKADLQQGAKNVKNAEDTNYLGQSVDKIRGDFNQSFARLQSTWNSTWSLLLLPVVQWLTPILNSLNTFVSTLGKANPSTKEFVAIMALILIVAVPIIGVVLGIAAGFIMLIAVIGWIPLVIAGIVVLVGIAAAAVIAWWGPISGFFVGLWNGIKSVTASVIAWFHNAWAVVVQWFIGVWGGTVHAVQSVANGVKSAWSSTVSWLSGIWHGIQGAWNTSIHAIGNALKAVWGGIVTALGMYVHMMVAYFMLPVTAMQWLYNHNYYVQRFVDMVVGGFKWLGQQTVIIWNNFLGWLSGTAFPALKSAFAAVVGFLYIVFVKPFVDSFNFVWHWVQVGWNAAVGWINGTGIPLLKAAWGIVVSGINALFVNPARDAMGKITGAIMWAWNGAVGAFNWLKNWFASWAPGFINSVGQYLGGFGHRIYQSLVQPFVDVGHMLYTSGLNFINMLAKGITDNIPRLIGAVSGAAKAVWSFLGFHSPTKEGPLSDSDQYMPNMMKMMATGITKNTHLVTGAVSHVANGIATGINTPTVARLNSVGGQGQQGQVTNIALNVDGKTVGTAVFNHLTGQMQLNGLNRQGR
ncbi:phage tail tape measure protein [Ktedonobacter robiniae]|uniref:Phage tail tape measure protein domain-containing protein n=1 Tax=Ktedonobacter robiniae TaxID=2778365 RepID=A0ABQ3URV4_9CHLR|nr:phage tail tape measure protein [Ktedonobacter robiniae]GHO55528.1 hypothetical protein KSB_40030 [Ktedonobacter robiniae]